MKNIGKILFGTAAMFAVVSCSNDDFSFNRADSLEGKKTITVNIADVEDGNVTRSAFDANGNKVWQATDVLRVYDENIGKFARYQYATGNIFAAIEGDEDILADEDAAYMLFPAGITSYGGYDPDFKMLYAVMDLPKELTYEQTTNADGDAAYVSNIPTFGKVTLTDGDLAANAFFLTGYIKVELQNGASNVKAIKVESMTKGEDGKFVANPNKPLAGAFKVLLDGEGGFDTTPVTVAANKSTIEVAENINSKNTSNEIVVSTADESGKSLLTDFVSVVYIPIVPGTYDYLNISYQNDKDEWVSLRELKNRSVAHHQALILRHTFEKTADNVMNPGDLEALINEAAKNGVDMTINVNKNTQETNIQVGDNTSADKFIKINLPKLEKDITLNIYSDFVALSSGITPALLITDASGVSTAGEGTLTINYIGNTGNAVPGNVTINTVSNVALKAESGKKYDAVTIEKVGDITLDGTFPSVGKATDGYEINGDINVAGVYGTALDLITKGGNITVGNLTYGGGGHFKLYSYSNVADKTISTTAKATIEGNVTLNNTTSHLIIKAGTIEINGNVNMANNSGFFSTVGTTTLASSKAVTGNWHHNNGNLTINGSSYGGTITVGSDAEYTTLANVALGARGTAATYADDGQISTLSLVKGASARIQGEVGTLTTAGIPVTIESGKVTTLTVTAPIATADAARGGIVMTGGTIEKLNGYAFTNDIKTTTTVYSEGAADISAVSNDASLAFKAVWTNETTTPADHLVNGKILTARQLMKLQTSLDPQYVPATVTLGADISFADDVEITWNPITWYENVTTQETYTFDGNNKILSGLKIEKNSSNVGFFSKFGGSRKIIVKNLTLSNIEVSVKGNYMNIGGLVGYANAETSIENVKVSGTTIAAATAKDSKVYRVGGLIGTAAAKVDIKNTSVNFNKICGWYEIGGLIGSVGNATAAEVTVDADEGFDGKVVTLTSGFDLTYAAPATPTNNGKIGMLVGAMGSNTGSKFKTGEGITKTNVYTANKLAEENTRKGLGFENNKIDVDDNIGGLKVEKIYTGQAGNYVGYSHTYATEGNVEILGTKYTTADTEADGKKGLNVYAGRVKEEQK